MFSVGDKVVHPAYGSGTIVDINEKQLGDQQHIYYVIELLVQPGTLLVPITRASELGLRAPVAKPKQV